MGGGTPFPFFAFIGPNMNATTLTSAAQAIIDQVRASPRIPAPSQTIFRVLELTRDAACDTRRVGEAISRDAGLTAQLLREANSALYGFNTPTSSVVDACTRLGIKRVRAAVINQHVVDGLGRTKPPGFDAARYWQSAFAMSVAAHDICRELMPGQAAAAGTAGLLCDFGIGLLAYGLSDRYAGVLAQVNAPSAPPIHELERRALGVTHAEVGAAILHDWKLDAEIIDAVRSHHAEPSAANAGEAAAFSTAVAAATTLADVALNGPDMDAVGRLFLQVERLTKDPDALVEKLLNSIVTHIQQTAESLRIELGNMDAMQSNLDGLLDELPNVMPNMSFRPMKRSSFD